MKKDNLYLLKIILICLSCLFISGCGTNSDKPGESNNSMTHEEPSIATVPLTNDNCAGMKYDEVKSLYESAGFKRIEGKPIETRSNNTDSNGVVSLIKIDNRVNFQLYDEFDPYTKVELSYIYIVGDASYDTQVVNTPIPSKIADPVVIVTPTINPTATPISTPTIAPTPTPTPTTTPTPTPTPTPTTTPTPAPTATSSPSVSPTDLPNNNSQDQPTVVKGDRYDNYGVLIYIEPDENGTVWVPVNGGKKYHTNSSCSSMIDPVFVTIQHAEALGYTKCGKCYK